MKPMLKKASLLALLASITATTLTGCTLIFKGKTIHSATMYTYDHADRYTAGSAELKANLKKLRIHWLGGSVRIKPQDSNTISISETANQDLDDDNCLYYLMDGDTLTIHYRKSGEYDETNIKKDLTVKIPEGLPLKEVSVDTVSASVIADELVSENLDADTISGNVHLNNCLVAKETDIDTTSGDIFMNLTSEIRSISTGTISGVAEIHVPFAKSVDMDSTSGAFTLTSEKAPVEFSTSTISGDVTLNLAEEPDATIDFNTLSGTFHSDFSHKTDGDKYIFGNGTHKYDIDSTSGSFTINRK